MGLKLSVTTTITKAHALAGVVVYTELVEDEKRVRTKPPSSQGPARYSDTAQTGASKDARSL